MRSRRMNWSFSLLVFLGIGSSIQAAIQYKITDIGSVGVNAINNAGQVIGSTYNDNAFVWKNGVTTYIEGFPGVNASFANGINDLGHVVGGAITESDGYGYLYKDNVMTSLGINYGPIGINSKDQVVGSSVTSYGYQKAFLWDGGTTTYLETLGGPDSQARAINDNGQMIGSSGLGLSETGPFADAIHAVLWSNDGEIRDLGTLGGSSSYAFDINNSGQAVGWAGLSDTVGHAFMWDDGQMKDIGTLQGGSSAAYGINDFGQIVGDFTFSGWYHPFLYKDGSMIDLNSVIDPNSGWELCQAYGINNQGQIIGDGILNGEGHTFFLRLFRSPELFF